MEWRAPTGGRRLAGADWREAWPLLQCRRPAGSPEQPPLCAETLGSRLPAAKARAALCQSPAELTHASSSAVSLYGPCCGDASSQNACACVLRAISDAHQGCRAGRAPNPAHPHVYKACTAPDHSVWLSCEQHQWPVADSAMSAAPIEAVEVSLPSERDSWHCEVQAQLCLTIVVLGKQAMGRQWYQAGPVALTLPPSPAIQGPGRLPTRVETVDSAMGCGSPSPTRRRRPPTVAAALSCRRVWGPGLQENIPRPAVPVQQWVSCRRQPLATALPRQPD